MTLEKQIELFKKFTEEQEKVMFKKGADYANEDRLSNFKLTASIMLQQPEVSCLQMIATKIVRLGNLLQPGKVAKNEAVEDSVMDLANYAFLLYCVLTEKKEKEVTPLQKGLYVGDSKSNLYFNQDIKREA